MLLCDRSAPYILLHRGGQGRGSKQATTEDLLVAAMSLSRTSSPQQTRQQKHRSQLSASSSAPPPNARMSPASRYHSNLKVLRRRDPSITSIFDQFSHVCVYHHNGKKWEKQGFEGSMFLYERSVPLTPPSSPAHPRAQRIIPPLWLLHPQPRRNGGLHPASLPRRRHHCTQRLCHAPVISQLYCRQTRRYTAKAFFYPPGQIFRYIRLYRSSDH